MAIEQESSVIVMLTLEEEKGRTKCHKYWPSSSSNMELTKKYQTGKLDIIVQLDSEQKLGLDGISLFNFH
jgi:protein tyrosine phosphatase